MREDERRIKKWRKSEKNMEAEKKDEEEYRSGENLR